MFDSVLRKSCLTGRMGQRLERMNYCITDSFGVALARKKSNPDTANSTAKMELKTNTPITPALPQEALAGQIKSATTGTNI